MKKIAVYIAIFSTIITLYCLTLGMWGFIAACISVYLMIFSLVLLMIIHFDAKIGKQEYWIPFSPVLKWPVRIIFILLITSELRSIRLNFLEIVSHLGIWTYLFIYTFKKPELKIPDERSINNQRIMFSGIISIVVFVILWILVGNELIMQHIWNI